MSKEESPPKPGSGNPARERYIFLAQASAGLGKREQTLDWLEKAYEQHDPLLVFLKHGPRFETNARFRSLLGRIGLPG